MSDSAYLKIMHNNISLTAVEIFLHGADTNHILNIHFSSGLQGIFIGNGADNNLVNANHIFEVQYSGIVMEGDNLAIKLTVILLVVYQKWNAESSMQFQNY